MKQNCLYFQRPVLIRFCKIDEEVKCWRQCCVCLDKFLQCLESINLSTHFHIWSGRNTNNLKYRGLNRKRWLLLIATKNSFTIYLSIVCLLLVFFTNMYSISDIISTQSWRKYLMYLKYSSSHNSWIFCFAQLLLQILVNYQNQGQIWNLLVLTFSKHPLHVQFDQVLAEKFEVKDTWYHFFIFMIIDFTERKTIEIWRFCFKM